MSVPLRWPRRAVVGRVLLGLAVVVMALLWANSRILALRVNQNPEQPLVLSGYYVYHAMAAALAEGRVGQFELSRYRDYTAQGNPLAPYRPRARKGPPEYVSYYSMDVGYLFIVQLARLAFPSLPDNHLRALALQLLVDAATLPLLVLLFSRWHTAYGIAAGLLYVGNRVFAELVSFSFYYYWDVPVTLLLLGTLLMSRRNPERCRGWLVAGGLVLGFAVWLRASWWPLSAIYFAAVLLSRPLRRGLLPALLAFGLLALPQVWRASEARGRPTLSTRAVWHVALVGLGYYPNPYGLEPKDENVFRLTREKYGVHFEFQDYGGVHEQAAKLEYRELFRRDPWFVIRSFAGRLKESLLGTTVDSMRPYPPLGNPALRVLGLAGLLLMFWRGGERRLVGCVAAAFYFAYVGVSSVFYYVGLSYDNVSQASLLVLLVGLAEAVGAAVQTLVRRRWARAGGAAVAPVEAAAAAPGS